MLADVEAALADDAAFVALVEAADALAAALVADVAAAAASTTSDHLATSALLEIGCDPLDVCATIQI